jgi:LysM repeat protein
MYHHLIRLLFTLIILLGWMAGGGYDLSKASPKAQEAGQSYIVRAGDSLFQISGRFYGDPLRWPEIFEATNAKAREDNSYATINNPRLIRVGQKLWIPTTPTFQSSESMQPSTMPEQQPVTPVQPSAVPNAQPTAEATTSTSPNETITPVDQLLDKYDINSPLAGAQSQTQLALDHLGFLEEALGKGDQTQVLRHTEHVVNILEGEDGVLFGDNDRDGQAQNPGDGAGVRTHVAEAQVQVEAVLVALEEAAVDAAVRTQVQELETLLEQSQKLVQTATEKAFQLFAADTSAETEMIEAELDTLLNELRASIDNAFTLGSQLL